MEVKINVDRLNKEQLIQILAIVSGQSAEQAKPKEEVNEAAIITPEQQMRKSKAIAYAKIKTERPRTAKRYTKFEIEEIMKMKNKGVSDGKIAEMMNRSINSISTLFWRIENGHQLGKNIRAALRGFENKKKNEKNKENKRRNKPQYFTKTEISTILKEHRNGNRPSNIAKLINRKTKAVKDVIYRLQIPKYQTKAMKEVLAGNE